MTEKLAAKSNPVANLTVCRSDRPDRWQNRLAAQSRRIVCGARLVDEISPQGWRQREGHQLRRTPATIRGRGRTAA